MEQAGGGWRKGRRALSPTNTWRATRLLMLICSAGATGRPVPPKAVRGITLAVRGDRSTVAVTVPIFHRELLDRDGA